MVRSVKGEKLWENEIGEIRDESYKINIFKKKGRVVTVTYVKYNLCLPL
jgi:hypothetical protein